MSAKPVRRRRQARLDVEEAASHYAAEGDETLVESFVSDFDRAIAHIANHPASGSPRYANIPGLPDLRVWPLTRFPYLLFYIERDDHIDLLRVLHNKRDVGTQLNPGNG